MSNSDKSNSLCQVIELPVGKVIFRLKLANNGEVLVGVLFQGQNVEDKMIPWEVDREVNPVTTGTQHHFKMVLGEDGGNFRN